MSHEDQLLTAADAAKLLAVKPQTLACWRMSGKHAIPYVKLGSSIRYRVSDLHRWIEARTVTPQGDQP
jgi:excisionase family DNA binding protein